MQAVQDGVLKPAAGVLCHAGTDLPTLRGIPGMCQFVDHCPKSQVVWIQPHQVSTGQSARWNLLQFDAQVFHPVPELKIVRCQSKEQERSFLQRLQGLSIP
jgi:predicted RNA-binding protein with PUA-like domain